MKDQRQTERSRFIASKGIAPEACEALAIDASSRRYYRLSEVQPAQLLMEIEPGSPDLPIFIEVSRFLNSMGLSAPGVMHSDLDTGLALIEDFGKQTYTIALTKGDDEQKLYEVAVDALIQLHSANRTPPSLPSYDMPALMAEAMLFCDWYVPRTGLNCPMSQFRDEYIRLWQVALNSVAERRDVLVLRDYHVDNLMTIPERSGVAACGLLDFQDALIGSRAYDLMSLCQDARRDLSPGLEDHLMQRYLQAMPQIDAVQFLADYWILAAQRHAKVVGIFQRLAQRDHKPHYLKHHPRVLRLLRVALDRAGCTEISELLNNNLTGWACSGPVITPSGQQ